MKRRVPSLLIIVLFLSLLTAPLLFWRPEKEEHYEYPPLLQVEGVLYGSPDQYIPDPSQTLTFLGITQNETSSFQRPERELEVNFPNCIGSEIYRLNQDAVLVKYSKNFGAYWEKFERIR